MLQYEPDQPSLIKKQLFYEVVILYEFIQCCLYGNLHFLEKNINAFILNQTISGV